MDIILASKKTINIDGISFVDSVKKMHNWYYFIIFYKNGESIQLSYYSEAGAKRDRDQILMKLNPIEKFL